MNWKNFHVAEKCNVIPFLMFCVLYVPIKNGYGEMYVWYTKIMDKL